MIQSNYNCTQSELYTICTNGWSSVTQHLAAFTAYKSKYTAAYVTAKQAAILAAKNLPDDMSRTAAAKSAHVNLIAQNRVMLDLFQTLKRYIAEAFAPDLQKINYDAAGQSYFTAATNNNWDAAESLYTSAANYITANSVVLLAAGFMPAAFTTTFTTGKTSFTTIHNSFIQAEEDASISAETKINANNAIYTDLMAMFSDAQEMYKYQPATRDEFTFDHLLYLLRGAGTAGIRGTITDSVTTFPVADAQIMVGNNEYTAISAIDGKYEISPAAAGIYIILIKATGYVDFIVPSHEIITGTISTLNIELVPL